jgi:hypothetical protein
MEVSWSSLLKTTLRKPLQVLESLQTEFTYKKNLGKWVSQDPALNRQQQISQLDWT